MVDFYLPPIVRRVLSPAATLQREGATLLAEIRTLAGTDPARNRPCPLPQLLGVTAGSVGRSPIWRSRSIGSLMSDP